VTAFYFAVVTAVVCTVFVLYCISFLCICVVFLFCTSFVIGTCAV
jgi:hypothetical protein